MRGVRTASKRSQYRVYRVHQVSRVDSVLSTASAPADVDLPILAHFGLWQRYLAEHFVLAGNGLVKLEGREVERQIVKAQRCFFRRDIILIVAPAYLVVVIEPRNA
eukprot:5957544-Pleurochrysis_carterae.AAC.1